MKRLFLLYALICFVILAFLGQAKAFPAPIQLQAQASSASEISLSWRDISKREASFKILRAPDDHGQPGRWAQIATVAADVSTFNDGDLSANRKYWYRLRSYSNDGDSDYQDYAEATTFPLPPTNLAATALSATIIRLSWTPDASGQSGFNLERAPDAGGSPGTWVRIATVPASQLEFSDSGVSSGATHWYRVSAYNASGDSATSSLASAMTPCLLSLNAWGRPDGIRPPEVAGVVGIAAGYQHGLALKSDGTVVAWGLDASGQVSGATNFSGISAVAAGANYSLALKSNGTVVAWGDNYCGEATPPTNLTGVVAIAAGGYHSLALKNNGKVVGWGLDAAGQVSGATNLSGILAVAAGAYYSLALKSNGTVAAWGDNYYGEATLPTDLTGIVAIAAGDYHGLALRSDGTVVGWGDDTYGQVSGATNVSGVVAIAAGVSYSLALRDDGTVVGWGANDSAQCEPDGLTGKVTAIAAGDSFGLGIAAAPTAPSAGHANLLATNTLRFLWIDNSANEDGFRVQRAPDNGSNAPADWVLLGTVPANTTEFMDTGVVSIATYWYRVQSFDACGDSPWSIPISASVIPPPAPSGMSGAPGVAGLDLFLYENWPNVDGFRIERANDNNGNPGAWQEITTIQPTNSSAGFQGYYNDLEVLTNVAYWYRARAFNAVGISVYSFAIWVGAVAPPAPYSLWAQPFADQGRLSWYLPGSGVVGFKLQRAPDDAGAPGTWSSLATIAPSNVTSGYYNYSDPGLALNTTYWYRVLAFNWAGDSPFSSEISVTILPPAAPYSLAATVGNTNQALVSWWDSVGDQDGFKLERAPDTGGLPGAWMEIATIPSTNIYNGQFTDTNVTAFATNWYRVRAYNLFGDSPYSDAIRLDAVPPPAPSELYASAFRDQINLLWSDYEASASGLLGYKIQRAPDVGNAPGAWTTIATNYTLETVGTFQDWGLAANTTYWYRATAFNWVGDSPPGDPASATVVLPFPPYSLSARIGTNNRVDVDWYASDPPDEDGFKLERATDAGGVPGEWSEIAIILATNSYSASYADTNVSASTTNWYRVRAFNILGASDYSPPAGVAIVPPPAPSLSAGPFANRINLLWSADYNIYGAVDGFRIERALDNGGTPGTWTLIATVTGGFRHFTDTDVVFDTTYWYRVRAFNWIGDSPYSSYTNATIVTPTHHFTGITVGEDSTITLRMDGSVINLFTNLPAVISNQFNQYFDLYVLDASTNLVDWTRFDMVLRTNNDLSPLLIRDTNAAGLDKRFYRMSTNQLPTFYPLPTGPFIVGTVDRVMIDPARTNLYRYNPPTNAFMVTFWYPTDSPPAGTLPALEWDPLFVASNPYWRDEPQWIPVMQKTVQHAFVGLPMTTNGGMFPVVLLSHGLGSFRKTFQPLVLELASHGYVVIAVDHPDCYGSEFPDGRFLRGNGGDVLGRLKDMQFLLGKLAEMEGNDPLFAGRLDLDHIGVFGHSFGGEVVEICRTNSQVRGAVIYDATNTKLHLVGLQKPLLVALGQANSFLSEDQSLFNTATNNAVFFQLSGAGHNTCTDGGWISISGRTPNRAFTDSLLWFFDTYLKGQQPIFPTNSAMYNLHIK